MNRYAFWGALLGLALLLARAAPAAAAPTPPPDARPVVHGVLFWNRRCPHCHTVIEHVLPPLQQQYGEQLELQLIEIATDADVTLLLTTADALGIPREQVGVPFLVIGDTALIGSDQIEADLPGLITRGLSTGGVAYPDIPGLPIHPADQHDPPPSTASRTDTPPRANGFGLAIAVLVGMLIALIATGAMLARGFAGKSLRRAPAWLERAIPALAVLGAGIAGYLAVVEIQAIPAVCGPIGDCNAVQHSPYARLFGVIPLAALGVATYLAILLAWLWGRVQSTGPPHAAIRWVFGLALLGTFVSLYLTFLEPFVIGAVCLWCLTSSVIMTLLMIMSVGPALRARHVRTRRRSI